MPKESIYENGGFFGVTREYGSSGIFNLKAAFSVTISGLYEFVTATFTPGGQTGRTGPSLSQARSGLSGTGTDDWKNNTEFFDTSSGIQLWTVPKTGAYSFDVVGASGGYDVGRSKSCSRIGLGGRTQFRISLTQGDVIKIVVGQKGNNVSGSSYLGGGGGGGTFVFTGDRGGSGLIAVAGGGGGAGATGNYSSANGGANTVDAVHGNFAGTSGSPGLNDASYDGNPGAGGINGNGGECGGSGWASVENTGGGAGWISDGQPNSQISTKTVGIRGSGFTGGSINSGGTGAEGGFGGGGATSYTTNGYAGGGGGGGYSGGGGGGWNAQASNACISNVSASGGGGGRFVKDTATDVTFTSGFREGDGYVIIQAI